MTDDKRGVSIGEDGQPRCWWHGGLADYQTYHDLEWGHPVKDDFRLFEKISLEGFQAGLSWLTILRKRENFRRAFVGFDFHQIADFTDQDVERLLQDAGIVRHRGKITAVINNAAKAKDLVDEAGSLAAYFWQFEPAENGRADKADIPAQTEASKRLSKDLKKRGWRFVGPTTVYAFMQAMGLVNDHLEGCAWHQVVANKRRQFVRPKLKTTAKK